jgi:hypothetical protein
MAISLNLNKKRYSKIRRAIPGYTIGRDVVEVEKTPKGPTRSSNSFSLYRNWMGVGGKFEEVVDWKYL